MTDDRRKLTLTVPQWLVDLADELVGCVFMEPHSKPGLVNHVFLRDRSAAVTHLAGRGIVQVGATVVGQIDRDGAELKGWRTIGRFFAKNRDARLFRRSDVGLQDHAARAIMTAWSDDEGEGLPRSEVGHNIEALEASLSRLERAADALRSARAGHLPTAAVA